MKIPGLYISRSALSGRGVFCSEDISKGSVIEICPVLVLPPEQLALIEITDLYDYYFQWNEDEQSCALALGYGSLYNHSYAPNATYHTDFENETLDIIALCDIPAGKEITFNYNGTPSDLSALWFECK